tara:strand:- start:609 stop:845 length:237 start_codon:yes stop_codon:yes gene_type:complete
MKRTLHISTQMGKHGKAAGGHDKCMVRILEGNRTVKLIIGVSYGLAITNLMEEWGCSNLEYSPLAEIKFLSKKPLQFL